MNIRYDIQNINVVVSADTKRWDRIFILVNFNFLQHHSHIRCVEISPQLHFDKAHYNGRYSHLCATSSIIN